MQRLLTVLNEGLAAAGTATVMLVMLLMDADIASRNLFGQPLRGVPEMVSASLAVIVFLQLPATLAHGRMIRADALLMVLARRAPRLLSALEAVFCVAGAAVFGLAAAAVWPLLAQTWTSNDYYGNVGVFAFPKWPVRAVVLVGMGMAALQFAVQAAGHVRAVRGAPAARPAGVAA